MTLVSSFIELVSYDVETLKKYAVWTIVEDPTLEKFLDHFKYFMPAFVGQLGSSVSTMCLTCV